jgi:hypothetical protein
MTLPTKSAFVMMVAFMKGSSTWSSLDGSGKSVGLFTTKAVSGFFLV